MNASELRSFDIRRAPGPLGLWIVAVAVAALAGFFVVGTSPVVVIGASGVVVVTSILVLDGRRWGFFANFGWIPYAWMALCLAPAFAFTSRDPTDTSIASTSLESFTQVIVYMIVAGLVLHYRRGLVNRNPTPIRKGPILVWPLIAVASTAWSIVPLFTFVRALQLLVPIGLALLMVRISASSPARAAAIWRETLRLFVRVVTILALLGFAAGFWKDRFSWPGVHPGVASTYMGIAVLMLAACGRSFLGFRMSSYAFRLMLFAVGLYLGQTRTVIAALLVALAVMFWWMGRTRPLARYLGLLYYVLALVFVILVAAPEVAQYLSRGQTSEGLISLTGRIPLWEQSIELIADAGRWLTGFGYGAARVILPTRVEWAGTAHSSWIELLLSIGILGPLLLFADILYVLARGWSRRSLTTPALVVSLLAFLLVDSLTSETLVFPGVGFAMLVLLHAPVLAEEGSSNTNAVASQEAARRTAGSGSMDPPAFIGHL